MAEDEGPAPHNGRRAVNSLIMLLVPGAGHAHRVEEHVSVKLDLGDTFSWQVHNQAPPYPPLPCGKGDKAGCTG